MFCGACGLHRSSFWPRRWTWAFRFHALYPTHSDMASAISSWTTYPRPIGPLTPNAHIGPSPSNLRACDAEGWAHHTPNAFSAGPIVVTHFYRTRQTTRPCSPIKHGIHVWARNFRANGNGSFVHFGRSRILPGFNTASGSKRSLTVSKCGSFWTHTSVREIRTYVVAMFG